MTFDYPLNLPRAVDALKAFACQVELDRGAKRLRARRPGHRRWQYLPVHAFENGRLYVQASDIQRVVKY